MAAVPTMAKVIRQSSLQKPNKEPTVENLRPLLPLVSMLYGNQSHFPRSDQNGLVRDILQGEGGEQGCPLMPALFALAQHEALVTANKELLPGEHIL